MNKIRICHFVNHITGKSDGVYAHLMMLLKYLDKSKYKQYLIFQGNKVIENEVRSLGVEVFVMPSLNKKFSLKSFIQFYQFIKSQKVDIIHTHFLKPYTIGALTNIILRKKLIFNYHGLFINNLYNSFGEKLLYKFFHGLSNICGSVDIAIVPSHTSREILLNETRLFHNVRVYYNGYDPVKESVTDAKIVDYLTKLKERYFIAGIIARIEIQKRIDVSLKIAKIIVDKYPNAFFIFFGDGPAEPEMKALAQSLGLNRNVNFLGFVPNVKAYIKYFDLLLFTSDWEGLPLSLWEAMASGVPILSTDAGGIKEIIEQEKCGIVFPKNSLPEGVAAIEKLILDNELKNKLGKNGLEAIKNKYTLSAFIKTMETIYQDI